jgi:hypothetical protein
MSMTNVDSRLAPIAIFAYNRPWHLQQTVEALLKNPESAESDLYIFSDGPKNNLTVESVAAVRAYIRQISGFKDISIIEREHNYGLARSIIEGVSQVCAERGRVIVLEDDLVTSPSFLKFMNDGLDYYEPDDRVISIHGYTFPVSHQLPQTFFLRGTGCLGWATWQRGWSIFEHDGQKLLDQLIELKLGKIFDCNGSYPYTRMLRDQIAGKNNSWAVRWHASAFLQNKLTLHPGEALILHIGNDGSGTNYGTDDMMGDKLSSRSFQVSEIPVEHNISVYRLYENYYSSFKSHYIKSIAGKLKRLFCMGCLKNAE